MTVADAHIHLFRGGWGIVGPFGGPVSVRDQLVVYERLRREYAIERSLVVGFEGERRHATNNDHVLELAPAHAWMAPVAYLRASPPPTVAALRSLLGRGAVGFSLYASTEAEARALAEWPVALLAELSAQRSIVSVNAPPAAIALLAEIIDALEGCQILFSHLGLPGRFKDAPALDQAREHLAPLLAHTRRDGVAVKLSGLYAICDPNRDDDHLYAKPFVDVVLDAFGPRRMMWGSDFPPVLDFVSFDHALDTTSLLSSCSPEEVSQIMGGNLLRLLK